MLRFHIDTFVILTTVLEVTSCVLASTVRITFTQASCSRHKDKVGKGENKNIQKIIVREGVNRP